MDTLVEIIVLDDGDDEERPSCSPEAEENPSAVSKSVLPMSEPQSNESKDDRRKQNRVSMSTENQKLFEEFVEYCSKVTVEHPEVIAFLQRCLSKANTTYLSSVEFRNTLGRCLTRVQCKQTKVYVYINELCTVLKAHSEKKKVTLQTQVDDPHRVKVEPENAKKDPGVVAPEKKVGSNKQIRRLENLLRLYSNEIQKLQERELTLDDMDNEDSTYIQESRLKQKMLRIFEKLCELKDCTSLTGRVIEQRIQYQGTRYKEVNRRLEKFINKNGDIFPDYSDILLVVQKANERHNLGLTRKHMQSIAQDAFRELGNKLQHRRHLDMVYNFGSHLTDTYKSGLDPAEQDQSLARRLRENRSLAENRLEEVIKKYAEMQDEGEVEDWKNRNRDSELPSTSKDVTVDKGSPRSRKTQSPLSDESEEDEDEESEESDVDIEEELRQSQEAADGEEDEEIPAIYLNEIDQKMEETSDPQNSSPAGKEREHERSDHSDQDEYEEAVEEETDKDEDQDLSSGSTSLSPEKEDVNRSVQSEVDTADPASPDDSNDVQPVSRTHKHYDEQEGGNVTSGVTSETDSENHTMEHLKMTVFEEDFIMGEEDNHEIVNVPSVEAEMPSSKEQGNGKCTDSKNNLAMDGKSSTVKGKEGKTSRLDKFISKITGSLTHKDTTETEEEPSVASEQECFRHVNNEETDSGGTPRTQGQGSNLKLVCVDTPGERWDSVRKIAFSHSRAAEKSADVVQLDSYKSSACSEASNGVHRAVVMSASPANRLKRKRDVNTPTDSVFTVKVEELGTNRRKKKTTSRIWTENGVEKYNREENGKPKHKSAKLSSSYTSCSSPSEPCSDNEHDLTLDLMVTCSPQVTPTRTPSRRNRTDAATQCDPDEVIVLSD